jgi:hypothetical protein
MREIDRWAALVPFDWQLAKSDSSSTSPDDAGHDGHASIFGQFRRRSQKGDGCESRPFYSALIASMTALKPADMWRRLG